MMKITARIMTMISYVFSSILWLLGILTLLFNILGFWVLWHLAGFGFVFYIPVLIVPALLSIIFSCISKERKLIIMNLISIAVSIGFILLTVFVSAGWFW